MIEIELKGRYITKEERAVVEAIIEYVWKKGYDIILFEGGRNNLHVREVDFNYEQHCDMFDYSHSIIYSKKAYKDDFKGFENYRKDILRDIAYAYFVRD